MGKKQPQLSELEHGSQWTAHVSKLAALLITSVRHAGLYKPGGLELADPERIQDCVETTRLRYKQVDALLQQALSGS
jgi:hypothetical protein